MPILDNNMQVTGSYQSLLDVTRNHLEQRRTRTLSAISAIVTQSPLDGNTWDRITEQLTNNEDLPQALIYSLGSGDEDQNQLYCKLESSVMVKQSVALESFRLDDVDHGIARLLRQSRTLDTPLYLSKRKAYGHSDLWLQREDGSTAPDLCNVLLGFLNDFKPSPLGDACDSIVVMPIQFSHSQKTIGFIILGLHTRMPYDEEYQSFMKNLQETISATITSATLWREGQLHSEKQSAQLLRQMQETKAIESRFSQLARHAPIGICIYSAVRQTSTQIFKFSFQKQAFLDHALYRSSEAGSICGLALHHPLNYAWTHCQFSRTEQWRLQTGSGTPSPISKDLTLLALAGGLLSSIQMIYQSLLPRFHSCSLTNNPYISKFG